MFIEYSLHFRKEISFNMAVGCCGSNPYIRFVKEKNRRVALSSPRPRCPALGFNPASHIHWPLRWYFQTASLVVVGTHCTCACLGKQQYGFLDRIDRSSLDLFVVSCDMSWRFSAF